MKKEFNESIYIEQKKCRDENYNLNLKMREEIQRIQLRLFQFNRKALICSEVTGEDFDFTEQNTCLKKCLPFLDRIQAEIASEI